MFDRILVAVDGSPTAWRGLKAALELSAEQRATLTVLYVVDDTLAVRRFHANRYVLAEQLEALVDELREAGRAVLAKAGKMASAQGARVRPVMVECRGSRVADRIVEQARKEKADLIVLGTHGRRGLARLVMGSDAEAVVREAPVPVLLVRGRTRARRGHEGASGSRAAD